MGSVFLTSEWSRKARIWLESEIKKGNDGDLVIKSCLTLATPWTVARQAPLSMDSPGKNTGVGCHFLLQGIFLTQE